MDVFRPFDLSLSAIGAPACDTSFPSLETPEADEIGDRLLWGEALGSGRCGHSDTHHTPLYRQESSSVSCTDENESAADDRPMDSNKLPNSSTSAAATTSETSSSSSSANALWSSRLEPSSSPQHTATNEIALSHVACLTPSTPNSTHSSASSASGDRSGDLDDSSPTQEPRRAVANARERVRVRNLRSAFESLGHLLPKDRAEPVFRRMDIVRRAIDYIVFLVDLSANDDAFPLDDAMTDPKEMFLNRGIAKKRSRRLISEFRISCNERARGRAVEMRAAFRRLQAALPPGCGLESPTGQGGSELGRFGSESEDDDLFLPVKALAKSPMCPDGGRRSSDATSQTVKSSSPGVAPRQPLEDLPRIEILRRATAYIGLLTLLADNEIQDAIWQGGFGDEGEENTTVNTGGSHMDLMADDVPTSFPWSFPSGSPILHGIDDQSLDLNSYLSLPCQSTTQLSSSAGADVE